MKNNEYKRYVRLGVAVTFLAMLCTVPCATLEAQVAQSTQYYFPNSQGVNVIVRESATGVPVIYYRALQSTRFAYGDLSTGSVKEFSINDTILVGNRHIRTIVNDMRVIGDMCYFCGYRVYVHNEYDPATGATIIDSIGILGRFRLDPSGIFMPVSYDIKFIRETKFLDRMATYTSYGDTLIAMTGIVDTPYSSSSASCLAIARVRHTTDPDSWKYNVAYVGNAPEEVFTDIAIDTRYVVVASYRRLGGEKYSFYLRSAKRDDVLIDDDYTGFNKRYHYNLDSCIRIARPNNADIRLSAVPWDKKVYAAFACSMNACDSNACNTALCEITTNNMRMNDIQVVQRLYSTPHTLMDTKYLYKTYGDASGAFVALLHQPDGIFGTVVEYPCALTSSYSGTVPMALIQRMSDYKMFSMSALDGSVNDVRFGGKKQSSLYLTYLQEVLPTLSSGNQCMQNNETDVMVIDGWQDPVYVNNNLLLIRSSAIPLGWDVKPVSTGAINVDNVCSY